MTPPAEPGNADARYSLGLLLVRQHDYAGALELLRRAHELVPDNARYAYVYAVALNSTGASAEAMAFRSTIHRCWPNRSRRSTNFSGSRFIFGVGAGWLREETQIMDGDYDHRWGQTREAILAMKELWTKDEAEFHGKYYDFPPVISFPKPLQQPHPPIYVGAMTAGNVFRRVVTYGNGWMLWLYTPEQIRDGRAMLDKVAREFGRNPRSIVVVAGPVAAEPDVIEQYEDAGADGIVVFVTPAAEQEMLAELEQIAAKIIG